MKFCDSRIGVWAALAVAVVTALSVAGAFGQESRARFEVETIGQGRPVVFVPGLTSSGEVFRPFVAGLEARESHLVTLAGFAGVPAPQDLSAFTSPAAESLAAYIEAEGMNDVVLVGHSMGGVISLMVARALPGRVEAVLIVDSVPFLAGLQNPAADPQSVAARRDAVRTQFETMGSDAYLAMMRQGLPVQATSQEAQQQVWRGIERSDQQAVAVAASEIFNTDYRGVLEGVEARVRVLVPHNAFTPVPAGQLAGRYRAQYEALDRFDLRVIEDSRHFIMLDQPSAFAAALSDFLEGGQHD